MTVTFVAPWIGLYTRCFGMKSSMTLVKILALFSNMCKVILETFGDISYNMARTLVAPSLVHSVCLVSDRS